MYECCKPKLLEFLKYRRSMLEYNEANIRKMEIVDAGYSDSEEQEPSQNATVYYTKTDLLSDTTSCPDNHVPIRKCLIHRSADLQSGGAVRFTP